MLATVSNQQVWSYTTDPDTTVHDSLSNFSQSGDFFFNISNNTLFLCVQGGPTQTWHQLLDSTQVSSLISNIPQSDWNESNISASDYIKNKPFIPSAQIQSDWNQSNSSSLDFIKNKPTVPGSQIQSDWSQTNTSSVDYIKNKPAGRSQSTSSRSLNSIYQVSTTRDSLLSYSIDISCTLSLIGGQTGTVFLEMATNSGFTTGVQELGRFVNGNTGTLTIGLNISQNCTGNLNGYVPAGNYVRIRTENTVGTPTFNYRSGQETLL